LEDEPQLSRAHCTSCDLLKHRLAGKHVLRQPAEKLQFNPPVPGCALVVLDSSQLADCGLRPEEARVLPGNAAEKRKTEFSLGRAAARQALTELGFPESTPVLQGSRREPLWPEGIVGSITHCGFWAIAAVAKREQVKALGIDLEDVERVSEEEIASIVTNEAERRWVFGGEGSRLRMAMLFSAKESIYKTLYPLEHCFFDFHAVELTWLPERARFLGRLCLPLSPDFREGYSIEVGCQLKSNFVFTHTFLPSTQSP
jgi:enterobactin synthetase component D / holo-[acyl-carrier protein] synthase